MVNIAIETKVRKVGSELGVLLPKKRLEGTGVSEGATIVIRRIRDRPRRSWGSSRVLPLVSKEGKKTEASMRPDNRITVFDTYAWVGYPLDSSKAGKVPDC